MQMTISVTFIWGRGKSEKLTNLPFFLTLPKLHWIFQAPYSTGGTFQFLALPPLNSITVCTDTVCVGTR